MIHESLVPSEWIAVSLSRVRGKGEWSEGGFESLSEEAPIIYSQLELMRHRMRLRGDSVEIYQNGVLERSGDLRWDENIGFLSREESGVLDEDSFVFTAERIERTRFIVEGGIYFVEEVYVYLPLSLLHGIDHARIADSNAWIFRAIADLPLGGMEPISELDLSHWSVSLGGLKVIVERPEFEGLKSLKLADCRLDGRKLDALLSSSWHAQSLVSLDISGISFPKMTFLDSISALEVLVARRCALEALVLPKSLTALDIRDNPEVRISLPDTLRSLGIDVVDDRCHQLHQLQHLYCRDFDPHRFSLSNFQTLCFSNTSHPFRLSALERIRVLGIPHSVELEESETFEELKIVGGEWDEVRIGKLRTLFPNVRTLCLEKSQIDAKALSQLGCLERLTLRNCSLTEEHWQSLMRSEQRWSHLDLSQNNLRDITFEDFRAPLESLNLSRCPLSFSQILFAFPLADLKVLWADFFEDGVYLCRANALESLQCLSIRGVNIAPLTFVERNGFLNLEEVDLGENIRNAPPIDFSNCQLRRIRLDENFPQRDIVIQQKTNALQGDIFHPKRLIFRSKYVRRSITSEAFKRER
ncbi:MAG: hypothetical protein VX278_15830 [Myxococcota bacterium]|nr:hypothetical protein [Myxococcota bacterium]